MLPENSHSSIDVRAYWRNQEPDAETRRQVREIFGTAANKRLIADVVMNVLDEVERNEFQEVTPAA